ncbi:hypothetical protein GDO78_005689 [Eleutherodactylus coqui]|uniref:Proline and serine rich 2 n=1 Tax=Eleutherodactylus coqui TaxID=57060 RepID=A0A8J6KF36_ELECQ|nr:hypothetical protein GDO78_005689 [Eleutherodactylus coqui]KAG9489907.1 hypothetical protein GDO78_005689 [Eleutherodactylus coqui]
MPSNLLKLSSSIMGSEFHNHSDLERSGGYSESRPRSRPKSSNFDDENLGYLTNEEKNVLMFLEETLDAFEDDTEEPPVSSNSSLGYHSPRSTGDSHLDTDDIIDLVQTENSHIRFSPEDSGIGLSGNSWNHSQKDSWTSQSTMTVGSPPATIPQEETEKLSPDLLGEHWTLHGAIPTPVIIAQKILEKKTDCENLSPLSPKDEKSPELKKSVGTSPINESHFIFPESPNGSRFPNNIIIKPVGRQYNKTIAKAAVNVQVRKAQMLANLHSSGLFDEVDAKNRQEQLGQRSSFRDVSPEQTRYEALTKLGLVKEITVQADIASAELPVSNGEHSLKTEPPETNTRHSNEHESISKILMNEPSAFVPFGKTILIKGEPTSPIERSKRPSSMQAANEKKQTNTQEMRRTYSMPRPTGLRSQGITVQFSGRDSSEESRKDALKRLGLLSGY